MALTAAQLELPPRYRLLRPVATGGMATVYAAFDERLGRRVAVKVLAEALAADRSARRRFTREARAAARVSDHPHVVTVYDVGEHGRPADPPHPSGGCTAFIVMELLEGGTVADRLRSGAAIPRAVAVDWLDQAASALDAAHRAGIVHRDVKPANLLLDARGTLKVGDFGIALLASESALTQTGQVVGTAAYFSPEQAVGRPATAASDRYALGVVAFELLTGRRPFPQAAPAAQARAHADSEPPAPSEIAPDLPPAVDALLARALAKEPAARPATAGGMVEELRAALEPTAVTAVAAAPEPARFERPRRAVAPGAENSEGDRIGRAGGTAAVRSASSSTRLAAVFALAALLLVAGVAVAAVIAGGGGGRKRAAGSATHRSSVGGHATTTAHTRTTTSTASNSPASAPTGAGSKAAGEARGHALIDAGNYSAAVPVLRDVVQDCPVSTTDPCAYAWFDLGHALRLAGDPAGAIPVLQTRLQNPNQHGVVEQELALARQQAGQAPPPAPAGKPGKGKGHGHAFGHGKHGD